MNNVFLREKYIKFSFISLMGFQLGNGRGHGRTSSDLTSEHALI